MSYNREDLEELEQALQTMGYSLDDPSGLQELEDLGSSLEEIQGILDEMGLALEDLEDLL
jgi:division protein CdvB (Snf7/Vps24/ESCRT-III family)